MSWGRSAAGAPQHVIEAAELWGEQVETIDRTGQVPNEIAEKHQRQIDRAIRTVSEFAGSLPVGYHMTVSANGSVNLAGSPETWSVTLGAYKPVPIVTARIIDDAPDTLGDPLE